MASAVGAPSPHFAIRPLQRYFNFSHVAQAFVIHILDKLGDTWPELKIAAHRPDVIAIVEQTKLDLLIAKAKGLEGDAGIRLLIEEGVDFAVITKALEITDEKLNEVHEQMISRYCKKVPV